MGEDCPAECRGEAVKRGCFGEEQEAVGALQRGTVGCVPGSAGSAKSLSGTMGCEFPS